MVTGLFAALCSALSWAFGTVMFERIGRSVPAVGMTLLKGFFSILLMLVLVLLTGGFVPISLENFLYLALSGIIGISVGDSLFFQSLQYLGAKTQVLFFLLGQVMTMILALLLLGEVFSMVQYVGAAVLLLGVVCIMWGKQEDHPNKWKGLLTGLASIVCFSVSAIMVKVKIAEVDVFNATFYRLLFGTLSVFFVGFTFRQIHVWISPLRDWKLASLFLLNVLVITYGGFLLSMVAIKYIDVALASLLSATEPAFVLLLAWLINQERVSRQEIIGAIITLAGLLAILA